MPEAKYIQRRRAARWIILAQYSAIRTPPTWQAESLCAEAGYSIRQQLINKTA